MVHICVGKSRNMATCSRPKSLQSAVCQQQQQQQKLFAVKERISLNSVTVCASLLLRACYLEEHIPCHGGHPSERLVTLIRRCHLLGAGTGLAWRQQRSDSPATKIRSFRGQETRFTPPPLFAHKCTRKHAHTNTYAKSKRAVGQSIRMQLGPVSADLVDAALHVGNDWAGREWQVEGGGIRQAKTEFKGWDVSWRASSHSPWWPLCPRVLLLYGNLSTLPSCPWVFAPVILSSASSVVSRLLIWPETSSQRDVALHRYHAVPLTHLSQMPLTHPFWCLPSTCEWAALTGREGKTEGDRNGRGEGAKGGIRETCLFCKADRKLSEMLSWDHVE